MATTTWAVLKRSFISQGRKELLTPPLMHHLRGHSASLRVEIQVFCLRASLRWLTHLRVVLTPPFLLHKGGGYSVGPTKVQLPNLAKSEPPDSLGRYVMSAKHPRRCNLDFKDEIQSLLHQQPLWRATVHIHKRDLEWEPSMWPLYPWKGWW